MAGYQMSECRTTPEALTMPDILLHIMLSIDDVSELARLASVCKIWNDVHSDDRLWSHLVELHYGHAIASQIAVQTCMRLEYCKLVCLHSNKLTGWCEDKFTSNASCYRMLLQRELTELHAAPNAMVTRGEIRWSYTDSPIVTHASVVQNIHRSTVAQTNTEKPGKNLYNRLVHFSEDSIKTGNESAVHVPTSYYGLKLGASVIGHFRPLLVSAGSLGLASDECTFGTFALWDERMMPQQPLATCDAPAAGSTFTGTVVTNFSKAMLPEAMNSGRAHVGTVSITVLDVQEVSELEQAQVQRQQQQQQQQEQEQEHQDGVPARSTAAPISRMRLQLDLPQRCLMASATGPAPIPAGDLSVASPLRGSAVVYLHADGSISPVEQHGPLMDWGLLSLLPPEEQLQQLLMVFIDLVPAERMHMPANDAQGQQGAQQQEGGQQAAVQQQQQGDAGDDAVPEVPPELGDLMVQLLAQLLEEGLTDALDDYQQEAAALGPGPVQELLQGYYVQAQQQLQAQQEKGHERGMVYEEDVVTSLEKMFSAQCSINKSADDDVAAAQQQGSSQGQAESNSAASRAADMAASSSAQGSADASSSKEDAAQQGAAGSSRLCSRKVKGIDVYGMLHAGQFVGMMVHNWLGRAAFSARGITTC